MKLAKEFFKQSQLKRWNFIPMSTGELVKLRIGEFAAREGLSLRGILQHR